MPEPRSPADLRDDRAADRDDTADQRDTGADGRDVTADKRDTDAVDRDVQDRIDSDQFADRFQGLSRQIVGRLSRIATATVDPQEWPDLTPAALAHLDEYIAEQRRLAALDLEAVTTLLDQFQIELSHGRHSRRAASRDRQASADDRRFAKGNRHDSAHDRSDSVGDRSQSAIEREQVAPRDLPSGSTATAPPTSRASPASEQRSRQTRQSQPQPPALTSPLLRGKGTRGW